MTMGEVVSLTRKDEEEVKATDEIKDEVLDWAKKQIRDGGVPVTTIAREIGVSHSLISQVFNGNKPCSKDLRDRLQELKLRSEQAQQAADGGDADPETSPAPVKTEEPGQPAPKADPFEVYTPRTRTPGKTVANVMLTEDLRQAIGLASMCLADGEIGVVIGPPGCGKTTALLEFCHRETRAVYVRADITMSAKELLLEIGAGLGIDLEGSRRSMMRQIVRRLREEETIILLDEADLLVNKESTKKLEIVRTIWDEAGTGMVLAGPSRLATVLVKGPGGRENLAQFYSRVRRAYYMKGISRNEALEALAAYPMAKDARAYLAAAAVSKAHGGLRRFARLIQNVQDLAEPGEQITLEIVKEADGLLVSPRSLGLEF